MIGKLIVPVAFALLCGWQLAAAQEKPAKATSAIPVQKLSREQFVALAPDAVIDLSGERITKASFWRAGSRSSSRLSRP